MTDTAKEDALKRLKEALPYILCGIKEIKTGAVYPNTKPALILVAQRPDGGGQMVLTVNEPEELFSAIALVLDINITQDDEMKAKAAKFLTKFGLK